MLTKRKAPQHAGDDDGLTMVGGYHSRPGFGPFFPAHDLLIHEHFLPHPLHVGLVAGPVRFSASA